MKKEYLVNSLLVTVNSSPHETNDTLIARAILENRDRLSSMSMDEIAAKYHVSQPTISRFVKKLGLSSFSELKSSMAVSDYYMKSYMGGINSLEAQAAVREAHEAVSAAVDEILKIEIADLENLADKIRRSEKIVFMGSELSMSIVRILQHKLVTQGKAVYTPLLPSYQNEMLSSLDERTLLVCVSVAGRWLTYLDPESLRKCRAVRILLCGHDCDWRSLGFDKIIRFSQMADNISYNSLMVYVYALSKLL